MLMIRSAHYRRKAAIVLVLWIAATWGVAALLVRSNISEPVVQPVLWVLLFPLFLITKVVTTILNLFGSGHLEPFSATLSEASGRVVVAFCILAYLSFWYATFLLLFRVKRQ